MPTIVEEVPFDGALERAKRLGLDPVLNEIRTVLTRFPLLVKEEKDANGAAALREILDNEFTKVSGWIQGGSGETDWSKCLTVNDVKVCIGVEIQVSARSDLTIIDVAHLREAIQEGMIDVGVIVTPSDRLGHFLTDRAPSISAAKRAVKEARAEDSPLLLISLEHDGAGPPLPKRPKKSGKPNL